MADVADLSVVGLYVPAAEGPEPLAGDFYDVLSLEQDRVALFVGDISGHGSNALAATRRAARNGPRVRARGARPGVGVGSPGQLMGRAGPEDFGTLWYGEYQPSSGMLSYAAAGQLPPALYVHDAVRVLAEADAPALGTGRAQASAVVHVEVLPPGAVLVAYSDGLIERRGTDNDDQLTVLAQVV